MQIDMQPALGADKPTLPESVLTMASTAGSWLNRALASGPPAEQIADARDVVVSNFGFIDAAAPGSARDGLCTQADIVAASQSTFLSDSDRKILQKIIDTPALFQALDGRDGCDGSIRFVSLETAQPGEHDKWVAPEVMEIPSVFSSSLQPRFFCSAGRHHSRQPRRNFSE